MRFFESEDLVSAVMEKVPVGVALVTPQGKYHFANNSYCQILNIQTEALLTFSVSETLGWAPPLPPIGSDPQSHSFQLTGHSGMTQDLELRVTAFPSQNGETHGLYTLQDMSESLRLQRMKDTSEKILFHDLRSPVSGIMSLAQLLQMEDFTRVEIVEKSRAIYGRGEKMIILLENLLDFSKMEEGRFKIFREPLCLNTILEELNFQQLPIDIFLDDKPFESSPTLTFWSKESLLKGFLVNTLGTVAHWIPPGTRKMARFSLNSQILKIELDVSLLDQPSEMQIYDHVSSVEGKFIPLHYTTLLYLKALEGKMETSFNHVHPQLVITLPQVEGGYFYR